MRWLLDVNALVALAHEGHASHPRVLGWFASLLDSGAGLATCSITEVGFVRVSIQAGLEVDAPAAVETLKVLKESSRLPFEIVGDSLGADRLPAFVTGARQVTDGHLLELALEHAMQLATLDKGIPGAYVIPPL